MLLTVLLATSPAHAFSYVTSTIQHFGIGHQFYSALMAESGDVCLSEYSPSGGTSSIYHAGDAAPTVIAPSSGAGSYSMCADIASNGYALLYLSDGASYTGAIYDEYTDELTNLTVDGSDFAYAYSLNENGYSVGYAMDSTTYAYSAVAWGPEGGEATRLALGGTQGSYAVGVDNLNRVIAYGYTSTRFGSVTNLVAYDMDRGSYQNYPAREPLYAYPTLLEDGTVAVGGYSGGAMNVWNLDTDTLDTVADSPFDYVYPSGSNHAGDVLLQVYGRSGSYRAACWSEAYGAVTLDSGDSTYAYALGLNDGGQAIGYGYDSSGVITPYAWDCHTGEATVIPTPSDLLYSYPSGITEDGVVILTGYDASYNYAIWAYDLGTGETDVLMDSSTGGYSYLYGYSQTTGDLLVYEQAPTGHGARLAYLHRID